MFYNYPLIDATFSYTCSSVGAVGVVNQVAGQVAGDLEPPLSGDQASSLQTGDQTPTLQDLARDQTPTPVPRPGQTPSLQDLARDQTPTPVARQEQDLDRAQAPPPSLVLEPTNAEELAGNSVAQGPTPMEGYELEENRKDQEEIHNLKTFIQTVRLQHAQKCTEMKEEIIQGKSEFERFKKESEAKYKSLLDEKEQINKEMIKQQQVKDLNIAILEAELKKVKTEHTLKSFRFKNTEASNTDETDECVVSVKCKGNCDHITCRMQTMKLQGGRRTSPAAGAENRINYNCNQCSFTSTIKNEIESHIRVNMAKASAAPFVSWD